MTWLAPVISHSKPVSSTSASRIFSRIPLSRHRQNRRCTFFQFPYVSGKSRQGAPVRKIQNTPLINCRVSRALPPRVPFSPIVYGLIFSHALPPISCRCCSPAIFLPSRYFGDYFTTFLLTTLSSAFITLSVVRVFIRTIISQPIDPEQKISWAKNGWIFPEDYAIIPRRPIRFPAFAYFIPTIR